MFLKSKNVLTLSLGLTLVFILYYHATSEPTLTLKGLQLELGKLRAVVKEGAATQHALKEHQSGGFFVECGGLDGERSSNTYHLEAAGWQGLLIEADSDYFLQSLGKNRRSWKLNAALCASAVPSIVSFKDSQNAGHGKLLPEGNHKVPCIPLALAMKALNRTRIDFLSLDVEGLEGKILQSLPYKELDIRAITMEYVHDKEAPAEITTFMRSVGYKLHKKIDKHDNNIRLHANDLFYIKEEET